MKTRILVLQVVGWIWVVGAVLFILTGFAGVWMKSGFWAVTELLSPFNIIGWLAIVITILPGALLLGWAKRLKSHREDEEP